eukprot:362616-Chlamydomonas_euryale.AAC.3
MPLPNGIDRGQTCRRLHARFPARLPNCSTCTTHRTKSESESEFQDIRDGCPFNIGSELGKASHGFGISYCCFSRTSGLSQPQHFVLSSPAIKVACSADEP